MKIGRTIVLIALLSVAFAAISCQVFKPAAPVGAQQSTYEPSVPPASNDYPLEQDSRPNPSVSKGTTFKFEIAASKIYPGTKRTITVYVPAGYRGDKPACVYVGLDGLGFNAQIVFDNLIARHAMPVTIGIGVPPGLINSAETSDNPRYDRSLEFDSLSDRLARFLLEEVLPQVQQHRTPNGVPIVLSSNPDDRAIGGGSTGAIGAFTAAWNRPDAFHRVFSAIGTYVGMRGGEQYYVLLRKTEPKPIRIFMQDGVHDEWDGGPEMGDWWMSNQTLNRALVFAGYDVRHVWGLGTHDPNHAASIFPDAMSWLWKGWPAPVRSGKSGNPILKSILDPDESWQAITNLCSLPVALSSDQQGRVFSQSGGLHSSPEMAHKANENECLRPPSSSTFFAFGPNGSLYSTLASGGIAMSESGIAAGKPVTLAGNLSIRMFTVRNNGDIYATTNGSNGRNEAWLIRRSGERAKLSSDLRLATGIALSPDGRWLFVAQYGSRKGLNYRVLADGTVDSAEPFYEFYVPPDEDDSGASAVCMDQDGRAYVATRLGIQIFDRNGRVTAIIPLPGNVEATGIAFGDSDFKTLYVLGGGKVFKRRLRVVGAPSWAPTMTLPHFGPS
jgi:gluconolactonase